ncbi:MAG TPA: hypothetical protein VGQ58_08175 [Candidatus Limnocylindrales bacterium]|nr:hypothetical protein [Candidatus Limnocylindrales bacterium]
MRRQPALLPALLAVLAVAWAAAGCGTFATDRVEKIADIRGPWRPEPLVIDQATIAAAEEACQDARAIRDPALAPVDRLVAVDARGSGRLTLIFAGAGAAFMECELRMDTQGDLSMAGGSVQGGGGPVVFLDQDDVVIVAAGGMIGAGDGSSVVYGRIGQAVAAVRVVFASGTVVRASIGGGWFTAWWPTDEMGLVVEAYDATGRKIGEVER